MSSISHSYSDCSLQLIAPADRPRLPVQAVSGRRRKSGSELDENRHFRLTEATSCFSRAGATPFAQKVALTVRKNIPVRTGSINCGTHIEYTTFRFERTALTLKLTLSNQILLESRPAFKNLKLIVDLFLLPQQFLKDVFLKIEMRSNPRV